MRLRSFNDLINDKGLQISLSRRFLSGEKNMPKWWKGLSTGYYRSKARQKVKEFGYPLKKTEAVHHIDQNPKNNDIMNLMVFKNGGLHIRWHKNQGRSGGQLLIQLLKTYEKQHKNSV